jgi:hypothetical protein
VSRQIDRPAGLFKPQRREVLWDGYVSHVYVRFSENAISSEKDFNSFHLDEVFEEHLSILGYFNWADRSQALRVKNQVAVWAKNLSHYWRSGRELLSFEEDESKAYFSAAFQHFSGGVIVNNPSQALLRFIEGFSQETIKRSTQVLLSSKDPDLIIEAASFWWAARALQLSAGCNTSEQIPYPQGEALVKAQYQHQMCRRTATSDAFRRLSHSSNLTNQLSLLTGNWTLVNALGSRRERAELYNSILPLLLKKIRVEGGLNTNELSLILQQILQLEKELNGQIALTWLGTQNASQRDFNALSNLRASLKEFTLEAAKFAAEEKHVNSVFYEDMRRVWRHAKTPLSLSDDMDPFTHPD